MSWTSCVVSIYNLRQCTAVIFSFVSFHAPSPRVVHVCVCVYVGCGEQPYKTYLPSMLITAWVRLMSLCAVTFAGMCVMWDSRGHWESATSPFVKPCQGFLSLPVWIPSRFLCCSVQERAKPFVRDTDSHAHRHGTDIHKTAFGQARTQTHTTDRPKMMEDIGRETEF